MESVAGGMAVTRDTFIIAEAGVNHNGRLDLALELVEAAHAARADAVKFQTFITEQILTKSTPQAFYQAANTGVVESQYDMIKRLELSYLDFEKIKKHCDELGIMFLSTPDEETSLNFLVDKLELPIIKIGSGEVDNIPYLAKIAKKRKPVILSTGMSRLGDIERAISTLNENGCAEISLLHCTTNYPCPPQDVNLMAMKTLRQCFNLPVGYSDHTIGIDIPIAAVALGARIIEKHLTLNNKSDGPDHLVSLNPMEFEQMVHSIRKIEEAIGDGIKRPTRSEMDLRPVIQKRIVAARHLMPGEIVHESCLTLKRSSSGILPEFLDVLMNRRLLIELQRDAPVTWSHFFPE